MKIKIRDNAHLLYIASHNSRHASWVNWEWSDTLQALEGEILDVETDYLFKDQFNTGPVDFDPIAHKIPEYKHQSIRDAIERGCATGFRIMAQSVEYVIDDISRDSKMRCGYCGECNDKADVCPKCGESKYIENLKSWEN